mgnify:CR=1 FL=1
MAINDWANAIASIESAGSGGYSALGPITQRGNRAYGKYQVMDFNIGPWTEKYLGRRMTPDEFLASPEAQDAVFRGEFGSYVQKYGNPQDAASAWFTGQPRSSGANRKDILGTTGSGYVEKFNRALGQGVAADTMAALGKGGGAVTPDQIAQGAQAQSTGMQDEQRPRGLLGGLFGNPDTMANLALAFNSMRLNPDPNLGAVLTAQMKDRREERKATAKQNRTLDYLRSLGTPQAMQAIRYAEGTGDIAGALKMATATAKDDRTALIKNFQFAKEQGYPGSFQDFLKSGGGGGSVINIGGEDYKVVGDQVVVPDPNSPAGVRFVPIPGGKTALAAEAETQRLATSQKTKAQKESIVTKSIDRLIGMLDTKGIFNLPEAGIVGSTLGGLGINQEAVDFRNELMTVQSNVAFDRLQQMREASKTGGALGAVSERELDLLISAYGNLQQSSSPKILRENLEEIKRIMTKIENDPVASNYYYNGFTGAQSGQSQSQEGGFSVTGKVGN